MSPASTTKPSMAELGKRGRSIAASRVLGEHAARCVIERDRLRFERPDALQDARQRLLDGQQLAHGDDATHGVRSGV